MSYLEQEVRNKIREFVQGTQFEHLNFDDVKIEFQPTNLRVFGYVRVTTKTKNGRKVLVPGTAITLVLNEQIAIRYKQFMMARILPHELAHIIQALLGQMPNHNFEFNRICESFGIKGGTQVYVEGYGLTADQLKEMSLCTGKQSRMRIRVKTTGEEFTITQNLWTRMLRQARVTPKGEIITQENCEIVERF